MENRDMPAFPQSAAANEVGIYLATDANISDKAQVVGLTKREYFAGLALQGYLSNFAEHPDTKTLVNKCVKFADALLIELSKPQP